MKYWNIIKKVIEQRIREAETAKIQPERTIRVTMIFAERLVKDYNNAKKENVVKFDDLQGDINIPFSDNAMWRVHYNIYREDSYDADVEKIMLDSL